MQFIILRLISELAFHEDGFDLEVAVQDHDIRQISRSESADLFKALYAVITRGGKPTEPEFARRLAPTRIVYEIRTKSSELIARLQSGPAKLSELYSACRSRSEIVATFMSILELCSMGSVELSGDESDYTLSFTGGNVNEILDRIVE